MRRIRYIHTERTGGSATLPPSPGSFPTVTVPVTVAVYKWAQHQGDPGKAPVSTTVDSHIPGAKESPNYMARGNQLDRQWRLLQLIDRPADVTIEDALPRAGAAHPDPALLDWHNTNVFRA